MINPTGVIFEEYDTELSRPIEQCVIYEEDKTRQLHDCSYSFVVH